MFNATVIGSPVADSGAGDQSPERLELTQSSMPHRPRQGWSAPSGSVVGRPLQHASHTIRSAYQPIFSFSHRRLVGHEALLRASDAAGRSVSPNAMFAQCTTAQQLRDLDRACWRLHAEGFAQDAESDQWLFLNVDSSAFDVAAEACKRAVPLHEITVGAGLRPHQIVIELLEAALPDSPDFARWTEDLKALGFLLALDDFGAGQSNFDRVFRLQPQIVKLDRHLIAQAGENRTVRRAMSQMVSLLHECGALVLIEGVESAYEANIALDSDADFVQGYYFGRPQSELRSPRDRCRQIHDAWADCDERSYVESQAYQARVKPHADALLQASALLQDGRPLEEACATFLALEGADLCFLLDETGLQIELAMKQPRPSANTADQFAPLANVESARWSRRPYFRRAIAAKGVVQTTRPYPAMHSRRMSVTLSLCCTVGSQQVVLCGDMLWSSHDERPSFGTTTNEAFL